VIELVFIHQSELSQSGEHSAERAALVVAASGLFWSWGNAIGSRFQDELPPG